MFLMFSSGFPKLLNGNTRGGAATHEVVHTGARTMAPPNFFNPLFGAVYCLCAGQPCGTIFVRVKQKETEHNAAIKLKLQTKLKLLKS